MGGEKLRPPLETGDLLRDSGDELLNLTSAVEEEAFRRSSISAISQSLSAVRGGSLEKKDEVE